MADPKKNLKLVIAVGLIVIAIIVGTALSRKHKHREKPEYDYAIYGIATDGTIYRWEGHTPTWPVTYKGKELLPLYICSDDGHTFAGVAAGVTSQCPQCGGRNVGLYSEKSDGPIKGAIRIKNPSD
jgi:hypothetical protein